MLSREMYTMECEVCGQNIKINRGNSEHSLCEKHVGNIVLNSRTNNQEVNIDTEKKEAKVVIIIFLIIEVLILPAWFFLLVLSMPGNGATMGYYIGVAPFAGYPVFIVISLVISSVMYAKGRYSKSSAWITMPLVISFGYFLILFLVFG